MVGVYLLIAIGFPLFLGPLLVVVGRYLGVKTGYVALIFPVVSTLSLLMLAIEAGVPGRVVVEWAWIPFLGINFSFLVDGLSIFFGLIVSGMGILITFYACHYLDDHYEHHGRFYAYLIFFMAAMLGTVLSNNLLLLFVFWELTGLASFLLIGFLHGDPKSRVGARMALLITGLTGLLLMAGVIMVHLVSGTYELAVLFDGGLRWEENRDWLNAAFFLIMIGAFGKSAQFPLHFWLPNAMAAPTPVSAYLHSATMVKLGIFLTARIYPLFVESAYWPPLLIVIGFSTMLVGAALALVSHDLKAILAYSTVSQLGFLIGYYGLGAVTGVEHDYLHILNHVFFKGCLFMLVGIVDHATGIRDIRQLGGLFKRMPALGWTGLIACAAMAGIPGTTGFISKEMMFKEIFAAVETHGGLGIWASSAMVIASMLKVAFSARLFFHLFLGREPEAAREHFHWPGWPVQFPPMLLAAAALLFGMLPGLLDGPIHGLSVAGLHAERYAPLAVWHGLTLELFASGAVVLAGMVLFLFGWQTGWRWGRVPWWFQFDRMFENGIKGFSEGSKIITRRLRSDQPPEYLLIIAGYFVLVMGGFLAVQFWGGHFTRLPDRLLAPAHFDALRSFVASLTALAVVGVIWLRRWTAQIISLSVAGFLITFYFVLYRAPDLAMTQILVESTTLILALILLGRFPRSAEQGEMGDGTWSTRKVLCVVISLGVGTIMTSLVILTTSAPHPEPIGLFFLENTIPLAKGSNAVNTILVDFRGLDTLGEIAVLLIAMLGGLGLLMRYKRTPQEFKLGPLGQPGMGAHKHKEQA